MVRKPNVINTVLYAGIDFSHSKGPPSIDESPFILSFIEHLESLGWEIRFDILLCCVSHSVQISNNS